MNRMGQSERDAVDQARPDTRQNPDGPPPVKWNPIRAVVFDLDGLMFNTEDLYDRVLAEILQERGRQFSLEIKLRMMGRPPQQAAQALIEACSLNESPTEFIAKVHQRMSELLPGQVQPMPGLLDLLDLIETHSLPKSIATSSPVKLATLILASRSLEPRFDFVLTAESVSQGKPHPEIYLESARRHNVPPQSLLVLEDSLVGSQSAVASGALTVAVPGKQVPVKQLKHVHHVFESLAAPELHALIRGSAAR